MCASSPLQRRPRETCPQTENEYRRAIALHLGFEDGRYSGKCRRALLVSIYDAIDGSENSDELIVPDLRVNIATIVGLQNRDYGSRCGSFCRSDLKAIYEYLTQE